MNNDHVDDDRVPFHVLATSLRYIQRAQRQLGRGFAAYQAEQDERKRLHFTQGRPAQSILDLMGDFADAMVSAIIAARSAVLSRALLARHGLTDLPSFGQGEAIVALRDLEEHWDEWRVLEAPSYADDQRWLATRSAGKRWAQHSGNSRPEGSYGATSSGGKDGPWTLSTWNTINVLGLAGELEALREAVKLHEVEAFQYELLDEAAASAIAGENWPAVRNMVAWTRARDDVVRCDRKAAIEAAAFYERWLIEGPTMLPGVDDQP